MDPIGAALDIVHTEQWCPCVWKVGHATALALRRCDKSKEAVSRAILAAGVPQSWEVAMKALNVTLATLLSGAAVALAPWGSQADPVASRGSTPYVTHFIFRPLMSLDDTGVGKATLMEAVGTTQNMKGEKMLDKMAARCVAINVELDAKKYIDGVCVLTDSDGDRIVSTFDTRYRQVEAGDELRDPCHRRRHGQVQGHHRQGAIRLQSHACSGRPRRLHGAGHSAHHDVGDQEVERWVERACGAVRQQGVWAVRPLIA
jgi:hypothetical protein